MIHKKLLLIGLLLCGSGSISIAQLSSKAHSDFDNIYFTDSDTLHLYEEDFNGLSMLDTVVPKYKVFITGENHTYTESNARLWLKMIKYLHKYAGVRNIIFEYGFSYGYLVNEYLQTGDTVLYNSIKNFAYEEYSNVLKDLYEFNSGLDSSEKIFLCAIDIERGVYPIAKLLDHLLPDTIDAHDSIMVHLQSIESLASYNDHKLGTEEEQDDYVSNGFSFYSSSTLDLVQKNFLRFEDEYQKVLGENFDLFKEVITVRYDARNLWYKYENDKAVQQYVYRETYMHQQFLQQYATHRGAWFGQFGRCHTTQDRSYSNSCEWYNFNSLANRIKNTRGGILKDSVMTIGIIYRNDRGINIDNEEINEEFNKYFDELPDNGIVLFDFSDDDALDSVFRKDFNYFFLNTNTDLGSVYDYLEVYDYLTIDHSVKFTFHVNESSINLGGLNTLFTGTNEPEGFGENPRKSYEFSFLYGASTMGSGFNAYSGIRYGYFLPQKVAINAGPEYQLSGFYLKNITFYNLFPRARFLDIMAGIGYGYSRLKLAATEESSSSPNLSAGFIGNTKNTAYYNPAFIFDFVLRGDINLSILTLGYQTGYNWDVSKKNWKSDGEIISDSPKTSLSGIYSSFFVGLNF